MPHELANVAWMKSRKTPNAADKIAEALADAMAFELFIMAVDACELLRASRQFDVTAYDAAYLCIARAIGCPIAAFDRRLARAAALAGLPEPTS